MITPRALRARVTEGLLVVAWMATLVGVAVLLFGGVSMRAGTLSFRAHNPVVPLVVGALCLLAAWRGRTPQLRDAVAWWGAVLARRATVIAAAAAVVAAAIGLIWGTNVAGGPDSYCYLNQAEMLAQGRVRQPQPLAARAPWPEALKTFAPTGHLPAASGDPAIVPACPAGYPLLLAAAERLGGRPAMFWVVPIAGGLAVWVTFLLGRWIADDLSAAGAAALLAVSPAFLYQVVQPMTDIPAAAAWCGVLAIGLRERQALPGACIAGLAGSAALLIRPNLAPLAIVAGAVALVERPFSIGRAGRWLITFGAGLVPGIVAVVALNRAMHGGALESGYGDLAVLFTLDHVAGNLTRYPRWLIETQTPFVLLAAAAPWALQRFGNGRLAWWLIAFVIATFACYLPYTVWDAWWFLRFLLPAFPPLLVLSSAVAVAALFRVSPAWRTAALVAGWSALLVFQLHTASTRAVFELRVLEARFRVAGEYVGRRLPANAIVLAVTESGSVRFYSGRPTLIWSALDSAWLDRAIEFLRAEGLHPYFLFEADEEPLFREHVGASSPLGQLDWPPLAEIDRQVRIYDPADRALYRGGGRIHTDFFWSPYNSRTR